MEEEEAEEVNLVETMEEEAEEMNLVETMEEEAAEVATKIATIVDRRNNVMIITNAMAMAEDGMTEEVIKEVEVVIGTMAMAEEVIKEETVVVMVEMVVAEDTKEAADMTAEIGREAPEGMSTSSEHRNVHILATTVNNNLQSLHQHRNQCKYRYNINEIS
jgi:hypothetical protein